MCASAFFPFRLSDGAPVTPADWYQAISAHAGMDAIPDSVAPLPGAEVLVLGALAPAGERREASLRCGSVERRFILNPDPDDPGSPLFAGPGAAVWHGKDNPDGRGGPDDDREPLILAMEDRKTPVWLGPTPFDHPLRLRRAGTPDVASGAGWPADADPSVLCEAHPAFWAEALYPGEPLAYEGFAGPDLATNLPPYRIAITSARDEGRWVSETARIHCVTLIPGADVGAVFWRAAIHLGDDLLGNSVVALVAALEEADAPVKDEEYWGAIAIDRWDDPVQSMDDRPLLPPALAASVTLPFALPEDDVMGARRDAAESWAREEAGLDENPFGDATPEEAKFVDKIQDVVDDDDEKPPDSAAVGDLAQAALAAGRRRHEEAGFKVDEHEIDPERPREPVVRGNLLDAEITRRLSSPYCAPNERAMAMQLRAMETAKDFDLEGAFIEIADTRLKSPQPPLSWPALDETEAARFGDRVFELLSKEQHPLRHLDISGATIEGEPGVRE